MFCLGSARYTICSMTVTNQLYIHTLSNGPHDCTVSMITLWNGLSAWSSILAVCIDYYH